MRVLFVIALLALFFGAVAARSNVNSLKNKVLAEQNTGVVPGAPGMTCSWSGNPLSSGNFCDSRCGIDTTAPSNGDTSAADVYSDANPPAIGNCIPSQTLNGPGAAEACPVTAAQAGVSPAGVALPYCCVCTGGSN